MAKIIAVTLEKNSKIRFKEQIEKERQTAINDLISSSHFELKLEENYEGPFKLHLFKTENQVVFDFITQDDLPFLTVPIGLAKIRSLIKDYFLVCEKYFQAVTQADCRRIEAIDLGRKSLHNEGAELLKQKLAEIIALDDNTARALFTLICILHLRDF